MPLIYFQVFSCRNFFYSGDGGGCGVFWSVTKRCETTRPKLPSQRPAQALPRPARTPSIPEEPLGGTGGRSARRRERDTERTMSWQLVAEADGGRENGRAKAFQWSLRATFNSLWPQSRSVARGVSPETWRAICLRLRPALGSSHA